MLRPTRRAFTLTELLLVIMLIGVLAAYSWPDFTNATRSARLRESADRMQTLVSMCRAEAMNESRQYRVYILPDGQIRVRCQLDPIQAPDRFVRVGADWATTALLLDDVWVESVQVLPEGPPPIFVIDEHLELPEMEIELTRVDELERPLEVDFEPDGSCGSLRWVLRDVDGRGMLLTLDGRLGWVRSEDVEALKPEDLERPEPWKVEWEKQLDEAAQSVKLKEPS